jgi:putative transcriptional regulator
VESLRGHLLVAAPTLVDPNFARAVVLVAEHTEEGALGVVLNRPSCRRSARSCPTSAR